MKKRGLILLLWIIFIMPTTFAQELVNDYNEYETVTMDFSFEGSFVLEKTSAKAQISEINSNILFFPRETKNQRVYDLDITSTQDSKKEISKESILLQWSNQEINEINYKIKSKVERTNSLMQIKDKVDFPIEKIDN